MSRAQSVRKHPIRHANIVIRKVARPEGGLNMKITIDMENLQSIIEESAKINTKNAVEQAIMDVAHAKVDSVLWAKLRELLTI